MIQSMSQALKKIMNNLLDHRPKTQVFHQTIHKMSEEQVVKNLQMDLRLRKKHSNFVL
jgi:hypothetical protein